METRQIILRGDSRSFPLGAFDVMITDPPYRAHVHSKATSQSLGRGTRHRDLGFEHITRADRLFLAQAASKARRWSVIYSDVETSHLTRSAAQAAGATYIRTMPWVRWSMPQLSGDRPPQGFEHVLLFWGQERGKKTWNGSGAMTHLAHLALRGEEKHKAEKPLDQLLDLVSWFSEPDETVFDPYSGSGTTARACALLGRNFLGIEIDPEIHARSSARIASPLSEGERERVSRWLEAKHQISEPEGKAAERAARRERDREIVRNHAR